MNIFQRISTTGQTGAIHNPNHPFNTDEPSSGLDPSQWLVFVGFADLRKGTVIVSTHILSEVERLCSHWCDIESRVSTGEWVIEEVVVLTVVKD